MSLIREIVNEIEVADTDSILTDETKVRMSMSLDALVTSAIIKFIKGQKEHGGQLEDRNTYTEIRQETIDLFWYNESSLWKK